MEIKNPKLYRLLLEPYESFDSANASLEAFYRDLRDIRAKHRICDVVAVVYVNVMADGEEAQMSATLACGDPLKVPVMLASALGREQAQYEAAIGKALKGKR